MYLKFENTKTVVLRNILFMFLHSELFQMNVILFNKM